MKADIYRQDDKQMTAKCEDEAAETSSIPINQITQDLVSLLARADRGTLLEHLPRYMARIPGLGPRSGERAMVRLITQKKTEMAQIGALLLAAAATANSCPTCGHVDTIQPCRICRDPRRKDDVLLVVAQSTDVWSMERTQKTYRYHVLGGCLDALAGIGPEHLTTAALAGRLVANPQISEIVLALPASLEGATTAYHVQQHIRHLGRKITQLARGLPVGADLSHLDDGTIHIAMRERRTME